MIIKAIQVINRRAQYAFGTVVLGALWYSMGAAAFVVNTVERIQDRNLYPRSPR